MPIYEYDCSQCQERIEAAQKVSDSALKECPKCGGPLKKVISAPAIQFKGAGWYITDYARKGTVEKAEKTSGKQVSKDVPSTKPEAGGETAVDSSSHK